MEGEAKAVRVTQVNEELCKLSGQSSRYDTLLNSLEDGLSKILVSSTPDTPIGQDEEELVPLAHEIRAERVRMYMFNERLESIIQRLEV